MVTRNDGGPAYPARAVPLTDMYGNDVTSGMTLRDWFAGQQMVRISMGWPNEEHMREIAANCYAMADAMLEARAKP